uniref:Sieve element occlusion N-terminal domain-containing protein n=1 Tax=Kalanchoe fedtschenkoi TaxID=63787 RepID=A0A7N0VM68_KALFE
MYQTIIFSSEKREARKELCFPETQAKNKPKLDMDNIKQKEQLNLTSQTNRGLTTRMMTTLTETQISALHRPDGRQIDVSYLLLLVKDITLLTNEAPDVPTLETSKGAERLSQCREHLSALQRIMQDTTKRDDKQTVTVSVLRELTRFSWDAKAALILASFAMNHGVWMLAQMYSASSPALKANNHEKLHRVISYFVPQRSELDAYYFYLSLICSFSKRPKANQLHKPALTRLLRALVEVVQRINELQELPSADLEGNGTGYEKAVARVPAVVCDIINIVTLCGDVVSRFPENDYEISVAEENELSSHRSMLNEMNRDFRDQITECNRFLEETKFDEEYQIPIPKTSHDHLTEALEFLIKGGGDQHQQNQADRIIRQLRRKYVLLLVSDDGSSEEEITVLNHLYRDITLVPDEKPKAPFSILWIPLYSSSDKTALDMYFNVQRIDMVWHVTPHPSMVSNEAAEFIKTKWRLKNKSNILVALDPNGRVLNINAMHMIWNWLARAFPFTRSRERVLWKEESFGMRFLLHGMFPDSIQDKKYVFMYGGDDEEWIQQFTTSARSVAANWGIPLELLFVEKPGKEYQKTATSGVLTKMAIRQVVPIDRLHCWFFWRRLRSLLISRINHQRTQGIRADFLNKLTPRSLP